MADCGIHTVVDAFNVDAKKAVEVSFGSSFDCSDVRDASIVHKNVHALISREFIEDFLGARLIGNVAGVDFRIAAGCGDLLCRDVGRFFVEIENPDSRALLDETLRDGAADAAARTGDDGDFSVETKNITMWRGGAQSETPRFQGMKSFCASSSALV